MAKENVLDVVCGVRLDPVNASYEAVYEDRMYYFCSDRCYEEFQRDPARYAQPEFGGEFQVPTEGEPDFTETPAL
ncbi:MAG: YHS domain-containing protein [Armatimonadetes bacterium]|nr:YHS domain-containing protein [Armatimonadota bacterium]